MKKELTYPANETKSAILCAWLKEPGEAFTAGEALYEIESEKVVRQVTAPESGVMGQQLLEEGDEIVPGSALAEIDA